MKEEPVDEDNDDGVGGDDVDANNDNRQSDDSHDDS
jgi:hypothetical protein